MNESKYRSEEDMKSAVDRVQQGDKQAYTDIIHRFQRQIYLYCYYLLRSEEEAKDAAQDIFIKGLKHINSFVYTESLSAWLFKIAKNHCTDLVKKKIKEHKSLAEYLVNKEQEQVQENRYTDLIHGLLDKLQLEERQILLLRSLEKHSYDEIASIMDLKPATIRKKYERIRKKLILEKEKGGRIFENSYRTSRYGDQ